MCVSLQTMQLVEIRTLTEAFRHLQAIIKFCQEAENYNTPASANMAYTDWEINTTSLLYLLLQEKRFIEPKGCLHVVYERDNIVACSGVYVSDFSSRISIAGVRAFTLHNFRTQYVHGDTIFPQQIRWSKEKGMKLLLLTFNSYNDWLYKFIVRGSQGKATAFGLKFSETYKKFQLHDKQLMIKNTPQYILKLPLEEGYTHDFSSIECN